MNSEKMDHYASLRKKVVKTADPAASGPRYRRSVSVCLPLFENKSTGEENAMRILFDSGSDGDIIFLTKEQKKKLPVNRAYPVTWGTSGGSFDTTEQAKLRLLLPEFSDSKIFDCTPDVKIVKGGQTTYDLIVGIETMAHWNAILDFGKQEMSIDGATIPMRQPDALFSKKVLLNTYREATEPLATKEETERAPPWLQ